MQFLAKIFLIIVINAVLFWLFDTRLFPDTFTITGDIEAYFYIALLFSLLNTFLRPIISLVTLPFKILTLGLFGVLVNAAMLWLLEKSVNFLEMFGTSLDIDTLATYVFAGVMLSVANVCLHWLRG